MTAREDVSSIGDISSFYFDNNGFTSFYINDTQTQQFPNSTQTVHILDVLFFKQEDFLFCLLCLHQQINADIRKMPENYFS